MAQNAVVEFGELNAIEQNDPSVDRIIERDVFDDIFAIIVSDNIALRALVYLN